MILIPTLLDRLKYTYSDTFDELKSITGSSSMSNKGSGSDFYRNFHTMHNVCCFPLLPQLNPVYV